VGVARDNARRKALAAAGDPVLGVDTIVHVDGEIFGKPRDEDHARATLARLSGRTHDVVSGLALVRGGEARVVDAVTRVTFRTLPPAWLDWYLGTGEWRDRAGGYAIQGRGAALVTRIEGDYLNVVGLPVAALLDLFPELVARAR
jgi:septum formation protein